MFSSLSETLRNAGLFAGSRPHWSPERDMPDQTGKVMVVTGATSGIGYESVKHLLAKGAKVYALARSSPKGEAAVKALNAARGENHRGEAHYLHCDLADLLSVQSCAEKLLQMEDKIHVVFANAGIMCLTKKKAEQKTVQGHDIQFGTNVLGHHFLLQLLKPALVRASSDSEASSVRVVLVSSSSHFIEVSKALVQNWDPSDNACKKKYAPNEMYARSKLGNIHTMHKLADELEGQGVVVCAVNPGNIVSPLQDDFNPLMRFTLKRILLWPIQYGPITQLFAGTSGGESHKLHRAYLVPWARYGSTSLAASSPDKIGKTWEWCEEQCANLRANV